VNIAKRTFNPLLSPTFRHSQAENAELRYTGNWGATIQPDTISSSTWVVERGDAVVSDEAFTDGNTSAVISGPAGESIIVNKIVSSSGEVDERILLLKITANYGPFANRGYGFGC
jgi:hypothetical protein